jgi:hypothetical protein
MRRSSPWSGTPKPPLGGNLASAQSPPGLTVFENFAWRTYTSYMCEHVFRRGAFADPRARILTRYPYGRYRQFGLMCTTPQCHMGGAHLIFLALRSVGSDALDHIAWALRVC